MVSPNFLGQAAHKMKYLLNDNSTVILTAAGVVGTVGTAVLTGRATFKAAEIIRAEKGNRAWLEIKKEDPEGTVAYPEPRVMEHIDEIAISKLDQVRLVWPHYIPPVVLGGTTVACIILANRISSKQIAALAVASGISERALQEYKTKVVEKLGDKQSTALRDEIAQDQVNNNPVSKQVIIAGSGDVLCFEPLTGRYFNSTIEDIKRAENKVNYEIIHYDCCSLSTFFDEIGLLPTDYSEMVGWNVDNRMEVQFTTAMSEDKRPCLVINFSKMPSMEWDKFNRG